jgi:hypothetical protein
MKHQYFADRRDLFKYDLLLDVLEAVPGLLRLTSVLMLTPDDRSGEGRVGLAAGRRRPDLTEFLSRCRMEDRLNLVTLREFFQQCGVRYHPYKDDEFFESSHRRAYFASVPSEWLANALIFFDPDVGLEPGTERHMRRSGPDKYLRYEDLSEVAGRAHQASALVVYQHLQRNKRKIATDILARARGFASAIGAPSAAYVTDDDVVFLGGSGDPTVHERLVAAFERHGERHSLAAGRILGQGSARPG